MPNKYSESKLVDLYLRAGLEERPLPEIKIYAAKTDVGVQFTEIRQRDGLPAALKWRRDQFAQYDD